MEFIGKANLRTVGLFQKHARSQAPSLHRHYPASSVLRACPSPHTAEPAPHGVLVESHDLSPLGLPVFRRSLLPGMPTPLPDGTAGCCRCLAQRHRPSPQLRRVGFRHKCLFEARHRPQGGPAFTRVSACLFARSPKVTFTRVLQRISLPPCAALVASGRATNWMDRFRTHGSSPTFTAY
jgi:hypothetical protein